MVRMRFFPVSFLLTALFMTHALLAQSQLAEALRQGGEAIERGHFTEAAHWLGIAVHEDARNPQAQMELGIAQLRLGDAQQAIEHLRQAVQLAPQLSGPHLFLGIGYAQTNRLDDAVAALQRELVLSPGDAKSCMWLGVIYLKQDRPEKAVAPLDRAAELAPDDVDVLEYRGKAHEAVAQASYARIARLNPNSWRVHKLQGELYAAQNQHAQAIAEFLDAIHAEPAHSDLYEELGNEYRKSASLDQAGQAFQKELELSPNNPIAMYNLATIEIERDHADAGVVLLRKVLDRFIDAPAAYYYLGLGEDQLGKPSEAVAAFNKALALHPETQLAARIEYELARCYRRLGNLAAARDALAQYTHLKSSAPASVPSVLN